MSVDFEYVRRLHHEYLNEFLDSQMLIADRIKFAGEIPKLLGNFERLHHAVYEHYLTLARHGSDSEAGALAMDGLKAIAEEWAR